MNFLNKLFGSRRKHDDGNFYFKLRGLIGAEPKNLEFYRIAFTHRSAGETDKQGNPVNYERLEFLGDAVLGSIIAHYLYMQAPFGDEGYLTQMRSKIVSRKNLNKIGRDLKLRDFIRSTMPENQFSESVYGDTFESFVGAIYLDKGYSFTDKFIYKNVILPYVDLEHLENKISSYKSLLIEWSQKVKSEIKFETSEKRTDDHSNEFGIKLYLDGKYIAKGRATSKKKAEEQAAKRAYYALKNRIEASKS